MRRDLGQWDRRKRMVEGGERSGLPAGRRAWSPGTGQAEVLVLLCLFSTGA